MEDFKFYEVGGKIRDELLGLTNKDVDYVAVPTEAVYSKIHPCEAQLSPAQLMFKALKSYLEEQKFEIFLVTPECYTIRAKFPEGYKYQGVITNNNLFHLKRKWNKLMIKEPSASES